MLNPPNRRGTDPYARWCGRGGIARCPPIPIDSDRAADAAQPAMPSIAVARSHTTEDHVPTGVSCTLCASATVPNLQSLTDVTPEAGAAWRNIVPFLPRGGAGSSRRRAELRC
jgi:hypothetical protein